MQRAVRISIPMLEYSQSWQLQRELVASCRTTGIGAVLFLEHPPVITLGCAGRRGSLLATEEQLLKEGIELIHSDRGGDITYHGPGQLVIYPVLQLSNWKRSVRCYLASLEIAVIRTLADFGISGCRSALGTGVWVPEDGDGRADSQAPEVAPRKIASIGVRLSRWISSHGAALNITNSLDPFRFLVPCGLPGVSMTSMSECIGPVDRAAVEESLWQNLSREFDLEPVVAAKSELHLTRGTGVVSEALSTVHTGS